MLTTCGRVFRRVCALSRPAKRKITMSYVPEEKGCEYTAHYKIYYRGPNGVAISPFHDIPLYANAEKTVLNMVVEVPRWSNAKMEINKMDTLNPVKQDVKKGKLRFVHNCFPHHGYIFNYGALPQTWENPNHRDANTGCLGDNDPLDVCEIGYRVLKRGEVRQVKTLGLFALIDEGETDWKVLAIDVTDPQADLLNDIEDVEKRMPGLLSAIHEWFKIYKMPAGNSPNKFAFGGKPKNKAFADAIIREANQFWEQLIMGKVQGEKTSLVNTTVEGSPFRVNKYEAEGTVAEGFTHGPPGAIDPSVDTWYYVDRDAVAAVKDE